jgi:hypothetical protein
VRQHSSQVLVFRWGRLIESMWKLRSARLQSKIKEQPTPRPKRRTTTSRQPRSDITPGMPDKLHGHGSSAVLYIVTSIFWPIICQMTTWTSSQGFNILVCSTIRRISMADLVRGEICGRISPAYRHQHRLPHNNRWKPDLWRRKSYPISTKIGKTAANITRWGGCSMIPIAEWP